MTKKKTSELSRRQFLGYSALGLTGLTILPSWTLASGDRLYHYQYRRPYSF